MKICDASRAFTNSLPWRCHYNVLHDITGMSWRQHKLHVNLQLQCHHCARAACTVVQCHDIVSLLSLLVVRTVISIGLVQLGRASLGMRRVNV